MVECYYLVTLYYSLIPMVFKYCTMTKDEFAFSICNDLIIIMPGTGF
jgi:hypothetical protein